MLVYTRMRCNHIIQMHNCEMILCTHENKQTLTAFAARFIPRSETARNANTRVDSIQTSQKMILLMKTQRHNDADEMNSL